MRYAVGQYVELYPTIPAVGGGSVGSGTRGIIDVIGSARRDEHYYLVAFLASERRTGETAWVREQDLLEV